jgi:hypothetical protein
MTCEVGGDREVPPMPTHATALFADRHSAHAGVEQLVQAGFPRDAISIAMSEDAHEREFGPPAVEQSVVQPLRPARNGGVLTGIVAGMVVFETPGGLPLRVGGPLVTRLVRTGALPFALVEAGLAPHEARAVQEGLRNGSILVGVHASPDRLELAVSLLELSGGATLEAA